MDQHQFGIYVGSKIPHILRDAINRAIKGGNYLNSSDFIRDAIKDKLDQDPDSGYSALHIIHGRFYLSIFSTSLI